MGESCWTTECVQGQKNFSPPLFVKSLVDYSGITVFLLFPLLYMFLGFTRQIPSSELQPRILSCHYFQLVFWTVVFLGIVSLFSLGFMALSSLLCRYLDFLKFLWSAVEYFSSSPEVQVKLALRASQSSPFNLLHCLTTTISQWSFKWFSLSTISIEFFSSKS